MFMNCVSDDVPIGNIFFTGSKDKHINTLKYTYTYTHTYMCTCTYTYTYTYTHTYMCTCTYTYTYTSRYNIWLLLIAKMEFNKYFIHFNLKRCVNLKGSNACFIMIIRNGENLLDSDLMRWSPRTLCADN